ncbi:hypothetical protein XMIN_1549 [Xanthomonas citri pv. mangiferaeindicae LMG 941]|nr:hypothetical protein XMIN_1549 [Xanthomonas citri pv. mangiferaeindicae LMG 941]
MAQRGDLHSGTGDTADAHDGSGVAASGFEQGSTHCRQQAEGGKDTISKAQ